MRLTLREYLDKWYDLDENYEKDWEITIWDVDTGCHYGIYKNETYIKINDKYVRNDNLKRIVHLTDHLYRGNDKAIYVFVQDEPAENPDIPMFEKFKKEQIEKRVRLWNEACDEYFRKQQYTCWFGVFVAFFVLVLFWLSEK